MQSASTAIDVGARVHSIRENRGISVRTLAARAGFSPSFVSQVENGQASPSIASLHRIADALGISLAEFFAGESPRSSAIVRSSDRPTLESDWSKATLEDLRGNSTGKIHPTIITLNAAGASGDSQSAVDAERFILVLSGRLIFESGDQTNVLAAGDSVVVPAQTSCRLANDSSVPTQFLQVETN